MKTFALITFLFMIPALLAAQYDELWSVEQHYQEYGVLPYDYNGDSTLDLSKYYRNTFTAYDGTADYLVIWELIAEDFEFITLSDRIEGDGSSDLYLFVSSNQYDDLNFRISAYESMAPSPIWESIDHMGSISWLDKGALDGDGQLEIVFGQNTLNVHEWTYTSRFVVLDAGNGNIEHDSGELDGYMIGPYAGDLDGTGIDKIIVNLYDLENATSTLHIYFYTGTVVSDGPLMPREIALAANFPNPFNSRTTIPIVLEHTAEIQINVVNTLGQRVQQLMSGQLSAGQHIFHWDGRSEDGEHVSSGLYFYEVITDGHRLQRPMVLLK